MGVHADTDNGSDGADGADGTGRDGARPFAHVLVGRKVAPVPSNRGGNYAAYSIRVDGSALTVLTEPSLGNVSRPRLEPGGTRLLFYAEHRGLFLGGPPWPLALEEVAQIGAGSGLRPIFSEWSWSPDGSRIAGVVQPTDSDQGERGVGIYEPGSGEGRLAAARRNPRIPDGPSAALAHVRTSP